MAVKPPFSNFSYSYARAPVFFWLIEFFCSLNVIRKTKYTPITVKTVELAVKPP